MIGGYIKKQLGLTPMAAAVGLALASMTGTLHAQEAVPPQLETVVVSANKRIEKLEDVPMSITVLSDAAIQRNNVRGVDDLPALSPALTISYGTSPATNGINMRGIGTASTGVGIEADVAVIIDDIPVAMQVQAFKDLSDVSRIEVLKGPQSSLFGKAAVAGALNITTKPVGGPLTLTSSMLYTSDREWRLTESVGGQVGEKFGFRITASNTDYPGILHNLTDGSRENGSRGRTFMGKFEWRPTDELNVQVSPHYNYTIDNCCVAPILAITPGGMWNNIAALPASQLFAGIPIGPGNRYFRNDSFTGQKSSDRGAGLRINYAFADTSPLRGYMLTSITSGDRYDADDFRDQDRSDGAILMYAPQANGQPPGVNGGLTQNGNFHVNSTTQELRLTSPDDSAFRYVAGLWYAKNAIDREFAQGYNGVSLTSASQFFGTVYNRNMAVFGQSTWDFAAHDSLIAGLRYNREISGYTFLVGNPPPGAFVATGNFKSLDNAENKLTGRVGLEHHFSKDVMAYATVSTGYKGKAYDMTTNVTAITAAQQPIAAETSRNLEIGYKASFLDNRATLSVALFQTRFDNYQQTTGVATPGSSVPITRLASIGGVNTRGLEADASWLILPRLILNGSFAYTRARITSWPDGPCFVVGAGFNPGCIVKNPNFGNTNTYDLSGGVMPNAPKLKLNLGAQYDIPLAGRPYSAFVTEATRFQSAVLYNINQDPLLGQGAYTITNIGFGIRDNKDKYKLSFFVNNLFDRQYAAANPGAGISYSTKAPNPVNTVVVRTWVPGRDAFRYAGVRFDYKF